MTNTLPNGAEECLKQEVSSQEMDEAVYFSLLPLYFTIKKDGA